MRASDKILSVITSASENLGAGPGLGKCFETFSGLEIQRDGSVIGTLANYHHEYRRRLNKTSSSGVLPEKFVLQYRQGQMRVRELQSHYDLDSVHLIHLDAKIISSPRYLTWSHLYFPG